LKTLNKVYLIGSAGRDPEIRSTDSGAVIASLSIATSNRFKDKAGNWQENAEWHSLVAFQRTAEVIRDYVKKGSPIHVEGRLQTRSWDKDGQKQYRTEIVVENLILLGSGEKSRGNAARASSSPSTPPTTPSWEEVGSQAISDEDIPF
jgi:single-strand DNA-binding protein